MEYLVYRSPEYARKILLDFILNDDTGKEVIEDPTKSTTNISKSNWQSDVNPSLIEFANLFENYYFGDYANFLYDNIKVKFDWTNVWYQVYEPNSNSSHDFHNHSPGTSISNIFYIELKSQEIMTEFQENDGSISKPSIREGDTLIFDPQQYHRSPPNNTSDRKIIVSFNVSILTF